MKAAASRKKTKGKVRGRVGRTIPRKSSVRRPRAMSRKVGRASARKPKKHARTVKKRALVSRARTSKPSRATHAGASPALRRSPIPSPLPTRHVAPPRVAITMPARSMPPSKDQRRPGLGAVAAPPVVAPEFTEAGVLLAITYSIREGRRGEFFDLMRELKPLLFAIGGTDVSVYEDRSRPNYLMEVFRFKDEAEFTAFDDKFHKDRKIAAIYALLDDIVEAEKSDFKIFERRL